MRPVVNARLAIVVLLTVISARVGRAQDGPVLPPSPSGMRDAHTVTCLDAASDAAWPVKPMFVHALVDDTLHRAYLGNAAAIANTVASLAVDAYGGLDSLAAAAPPLSWRSTSRGLDVTAYRDGHLTWRGDSLAGSPTGAHRDEVEAGVTLLSQALDAIVAAHAIPTWPVTLTADSLRFHLELGERLVGPYPHEFVLRATQSAHSPFGLRMPVETAVKMTRDGPPPQYPEDNRLAGFGGTLSVSFIVDTNGRAEPDSFTPLGTADVARMTRDKQDAYRAFIEAVSRSVMLREYRPARVAGCAVRMTVEQQFVFRMH